MGNVPENVNKKYNELTEEYKAENESAFLNFCFWTGKSKIRNIYVIEAGTIKRYNLDDDFNSQKHYSLNPDNSFYYDINGNEVNFSELEEDKYGYLDDCYIYKYKINNYDIEKDFFKQYELTIDDTIFLAAGILLVSIVSLSFNV